MKYTDLCAEAEKALEGVTEGPWIAEDYEMDDPACWHVVPSDYKGTVCTLDSGPIRASNARFIAFTRAWVPAAAAAIRELEAERAELTRERDALAERNKQNSRLAESNARGLRDAEAKVARLEGAIGSVAEQAMFEEWQAEMGSDPNDQGDVSMGWHAGYDAAIRHARNELADLTTENDNG